MSPHVLCTEDSKTLDQLLPTSAQLREAISYEAKLALAASETTRVQPPQEFWREGKDHDPVIVILPRHELRELAEIHQRLDRSNYGWSAIFAFARVAIAADKQAGFELSGSAEGGQR